MQITEHNSPSSLAQREYYHSIAIFAQDGRGKIKRIKKNR